MTTYKIVRFFQHQDTRPVIKRGLTLEQAQAHCHDPETSSRTCKLAKNVRLTRNMGPWFDGYTEETPATRPPGRWKGSGR